MPKILTPLTLDGVIDLIQRKKHDCDHVALTFGTSPQLEAKLNAYDYCLQLLKRIER